MTARTALDNGMAEGKKQHIKVGILGCTGRVGKLLVQEIQSGHWPAISLAGGLVREGIEYKPGFFVTHNADELFEMADVLIDFTRPEATAQYAWQAAKHHTPYVVGTTGLSDAQEKELRDAAKEAPILYAANMSVGVNLLQALVEQAAARLGPEWDIEILETHHKHKVDAPSGTALALGRSAATGRQETLNADDAFNRTGEREAGKIGFAVRRGGDVVGEHTVSFYGEGERVELTHMATNRALFARGALRAALWLKDQKNGLYTMRDALGL